jgi:hypothetical protein
MLTLYCLNADAIEKSVTLYGIFETALNSDKEYSNPFDYTEVSFSAEFISPGPGLFKVSSFYDGRDAHGKDIWKIRFMPHEPGMWKYIIKNNVGATVQTGEFTVTEQTAQPGNHGHVKVDAQNPRFLIHDDGTPHYWIGGKWISARDYGPESKAGQLNKGFDSRVNLTYGHKTDQQLINYLDLLVQYKHNGILLKIAQYPLESNRLSWDLDWIRRGEWLVKEALKRGIYVQINLFDTWSRDQNHYFRHNMQGAGQPFDVWNDDGDKFKKNYLRYIISRFASFANVYWELGNEMEHSPNCGNCFIKLANDKYLPWIRQFDPYQLPIGLSEVMWRATSADIGFLHQTNKLPDESMKRPVIMNELVRYKLNQSVSQKVWRKLFGPSLHRGLWHDNAINNKELRFSYRRTFWKVFTHGGSGSSEATWLSIDNDLSVNVINVMSDHMHLSGLIQELLPDLNMMHPVQNFITPNVQNERISTRGNKNVYVSYFDAGFDQETNQGTINLSFLKGGYKATWLDPSTGKIVSEVNNTLESRQKIIRPSYLEDIVLLLKKL